MVGGTVIEVIKMDDRIWVNCKDTQWYGDECALYLEKTECSLGIEVGDALWWQGKKAYWTANSAGAKHDVAIPRIGYSGVSRPEGEV